MNGSELMAIVRAPVMTIAVDMGGLSLVSVGADVVGADYERDSQTGRRVALVGIAACIPWPRSISLSAS